MEMNLSSRVLLDHLGVQDLLALLEPTCHHLPQLGATQSGHLVPLARRGSQANLEYK